jgi:hypothetical protein
MTKASDARKARLRRLPTKPKAWDLPPYNFGSTLLKPFFRATYLEPKPEHVLALAATMDTTYEKMKAKLEAETLWPLFKNGDDGSDYQVQVTFGEETPEVADTVKRPNFPELVWLSIKRIDKDTIHDWRHLQEIKNMIVGPEHEAVELYPAEARLVDSANQYHLWVLRDPKVRFPFGFDTRFVQGDEIVGNSRQRPFK